MGVAGIRVDAGRGAGAAGTWLLDSAATNRRVGVLPQPDDSTHPDGTNGAVSPPNVRFHVGDIERAAVVVVWHDLPDSDDGISGADAVHTPDG